ncbi:MAG: hypothetical protein ACJAZH_001686 [Roseivirga sp.]|jgi:hypothetical protein
MEEKQEFNGLLLGDLAKIKKWTKFLSILSYVGAVLMVIVGVIMGVFSSNLPGMEDTLGGIPGPLFALIYLAGAALYYFSGKYLGDMAKSAEMGMLSSEANHIESLISHTAKLFSFWGIATAVVIGLYALFFILALVGMGTML